VNEFIVERSTHGGSMGFGMASEKTLYYMADIARLENLAEYGQ
jgi:hypothetical protein